MTCKLSGVYPRDIKVTWNKTFESSQFQHAEENEDGTFTLTSVLSFTIKEDMRGTWLTCQAGYEGLTPVSGAVTLGVRGETTVSGGQNMSWSNGTRSELKVTLYKNDVKSRIYCQIPGYRGGSVPSDALNFSTFILAIPEVTIKKTSAEDSHNSPSFHCKISGFYPDDIKVMWLLEGQTLNSILFNSIKNLDGTFTAFTLIDVNVTNEVKQLNCVVTHMGNHNVTHSVEFAKRSSSDESDGSSLSSSSAKNLTIIGPPGRVKVGEVLELQCHSNKDATFMWLKNGEAIPQDHFTTASNGALHTSRLTLQTEKGDIRSAVQCVQGKNEQQRMSEAFNLSSVITVMPRLQIQGSPDTRNRSLGKYSCRVDGFYPEDVLVSWTLGKLNISACCEKAQSNNDGTFSTTCHITIVLAKISSGAVLQCHAGYRDHC
ncbi:SHPS1 phosphatase, partial [Polypterus senegalus]|nr:SHPS1 phosphatase [Polypterus senegalus]